MRLFFLDDRLALKVLTFPYLRIRIDLQIFEALGIIVYEPIYYCTRNPSGTVMMTRTIRGTIIELDEDLGVPEGQEVEVAVRIVPPLDSKTKTRRLGTMQGSVTYMAPDFDEPLDEFKEYMP